MVERVSGDLFERLGPDLFAAVLLCLDDPADLVRSASVSHSWRRFVIAKGFCKKFCLRMTPEISCFVRAIEAGGLSDTVEVGPNYSGQWHTLESEHRIYSYLGFCIFSARFLAKIHVESIAASSTADRIENMLPNNIGKFSLNFMLSSKFCVVREIKIQPIRVCHFRKPANPTETLRFRLGHMRHENATREESLAGNFIWTYVSPEISMIQASNFQSLKLPRPVICIRGILQIEMLSKDQSSLADELFHISASEVKIVVRHLIPPFDVSLDGMGNLVLMYFPVAEDVGGPSYS